MNRLHQSISAILLCITVLPACTKQSNAPAFNDQPVIEAYLQANNYASVTISRQIASSSNVVYADNNLDSLTVTIRDSDVLYQLMPVGNGTYTDTSLILREGMSYTLQFMYNDKLVSAVTSIPAAPKNYAQSATALSIQKIDENTTFTPGSFTMNDPVELDWDNADQSYFMVVTENLESSPTLIRDTTDARFQVRSFRNEPAVINTYSIRDQQFQYFGRHRMILYHLNPDYATLYNDNSNSSQNLTNPTTNITNGLGIFTGISSDTLFLQINQK